MIISIKSIITSEEGKISASESFVTMFCVQRKSLIAQSPAGRIEWTTHTHTHRQENVTYHYRNHFFHSSTKVMFSNFSNGDVSMHLSELFIIGMNKSAVEMVKEDE